MPWIEFGHLCAWLAFALALLQATMPMVARFSNRPQLAEFSIRSAPLIALLVIAGAATLVNAFVTDDFSVAYVAQNSNSQLPLLYKVTALWGGHEGSLYLWLTVLSLFTGMVGWQGRKRFAEHLPLVMAAQGWLLVRFLGLILFLSSPFERLLMIPLDGRELNPLLQDPGMAFHPPMLYLGYVGFSVPFAFAMAALASGWRSEEWVPLVRRWVLIAWLFLTCGIVLGGWWAYYELGWGGYWAWDPVENASFMPWLTGTALLHSIMAQDQRRMLPLWNLFLIITTFLLSLLGTFLVRSGILSSVHAFAVDPGRGSYILVFMAMVIGVALTLALWRSDSLHGEPRPMAAVSRESGILYGNALFVACCVMVFLGTMYPLFLDLSMDQKITVAAPYFNGVVAPVLLLMLGLMLVAPLLPWRKIAPGRLAEKTRLMLIAAAIAALVAVMIWPGFWQVGFVAALAAGMVVTLAQDIGNRLAISRIDGGGLLAVLVADRRHFAAMTAHVGAVVMAAGLVGSGLFRVEQTLVMAPGDQLEIAGETAELISIEQYSKDNYRVVEGVFELVASGDQLRPQKRRYPVSGVVTTEAAIDSSLLRDFYLVMGQRDGDKWAVQVYVNPLVQLIWWGTLMLLVAVSFILIDSRVSPRRTS
ncbi:MAG: heme lyase CcmF/NrfE family subunit [Immundisolibacteraceae bacterium]|nr:heme lyase CcmF/NrfE family subunit [Immundisolibacteraceae bacterium]